LEIINIYIKNKIFQNIFCLGSLPERLGATIIQVGSVLDDYQWHDLAVIRYMKNISVKIDQTVVREESQSAFSGLDLDGKVRDFSNRKILLNYINSAHYFSFSIESKG